MKIFYISVLGKDVKLHPAVPTPLSLLFCCIRAHITILDIGS